MDKKELKLYVTPEQEIIDLELEGQVLTTSDDDDNQGGNLPTIPVTPVD
jgi:hypothetical protein